MNLSDVLRLLRPLARQISNLIGRGISGRVDDSGGVQTLQVEVRKGEIRTLERPQQYGFTSNPPEGSEVLVAFVGGRGDHGFAINVVNRAAREKNLESGESGMYNDAGCTILLKANGDIEITSAGNVILNGGATAAAKVGSSVTGTAGPYAVAGNVSSGSNTVLLP
jgi:phage baseplate assembly protein V